MEDNKNCWRVNISHCIELTNHKISYSNFVPSRGNNDAGNKRIKFYEPRLLAKGKLLLLGSLQTRRPSTSVEFFF